MTLSKPQKQALKEAENGRITAAPSTVTKLIRLGFAGRVIERFRIQQQAPHGRWFNRQFVTAELTPNGAAKAAELKA
jgi:hypothetical protein